MIPRGSLTWVYEAQGGISQGLDPEEGFGKDFLQEIDMLKVYCKWKVLAIILHIF